MAELRCLLREEVTVDREEIGPRSLGDKHREVRFQPRSGNDLAMREHGAIARKQKLSRNRLMFDQRVALGPASNSPVTKRQATRDQAVGIGFWKSSLVPNVLYRRIAGACHSVYRVILAINVDDNGADTLAAKFASCQFHRISAQDDDGNRDDDCAYHEKRDDFD